jgi:hypothetical protein
MSGKVYSTLTILDGGPGDCYTAIYQVKTGNRTYYLVISHAIIATLQAHATLEILRLGDRGIERSVPLIRNGSGIAGTLGFDYTLVAGKRPIFISTLPPAKSPFRRSSRTVR